MQINNYFRPAPETEALEQDDRKAKQPMSWSSLAMIKGQNQRIREQMATLDASAEGRWVGKDVKGASPDKGVAITLDLHGKLAYIEFNDSWLETARVKQISDAVIRAHQAAKECFSPPVYEEGLRDQLEKELADNRNELLAMMRRGFK